MPIEIKELRIKAVVSNTSDALKSDTDVSISAKNIQKLKKEIAAECLKQMKEYIKEQKER